MQTTDGVIFIQDLDRVDCALFDPTLGIYGQSWHVDLEVAGELDERGFVHDFGPLKKLVKDTLKETVDHALLIPISSKSVAYYETGSGETWRLSSRSKLASVPFEWEYSCPKGAVYPIRAVALKRTIVAQELERVLRHRLPEPIHRLKLRLRNEEISSTEASFCYTHGLPKHEGLCQRLFHGHRSRVEVYVGEERRPDLEHFICREVFGGVVHVASANQVVSNPVEVGTRGKDASPIELSYKSADGHFRAQLPHSKVFVVEGETSIENITQHLARLIQGREATGETIRVVCYEGIGKGAICEL